MTKKRRFELVEGSSSKFWEIAVDGETMSVCYGRIGTDGTAKDKTFASAAEAEREASKLVAEKTKKGYAEVSSAGAAKPAKAEDEAKPAKAKAAKVEAEDEAKPAKAKAAKTKPAKTEVPKAGSPEVEALLEAIRKKHREIAAQLRAPASAEALELLRARGYRRACSTSTRSTTARRRSSSARTGCCRSRRSRRGAPR
ncbi:WGR domain-containing protein [Nannocystis pusilla]|uniref:WGR domain-containing protein n=1 Tax=Nannocystis pusilla TaxID=889268 RepID=UPI003B7E500E